MIGALYLLAAAASAPVPGDGPVSRSLTYEPDLGPLLDATGGRGWRDPWGPPMSHAHTGRLCHQYARQPRAESDRICRGRP